MDLGAITKWYPAGSDVVVTLSGGRISRGRIEAIDADALVLMAEGRPTILAAQAIESVEMIGTAEPVVPVPREPVAPAVLSPEWDALAAEFALPESDIAASTPGFEVDTAIAQPELVGPIEVELTRVKNRLESAKRLNDPGRGIQAIRLLPELAVTCSYPPAYHLAGMLLLGTANQAPAVLRQAEEWLALAAPSGPRYAWDHAATLYLSGRPREAAEALAASLVQAPADDVTDRLLCLFVRLAVSEGMAGRAADVLGAALDTSPRIRSVAIRAGLYLVHQEYQERAHPLEAILLQGRSSHDDLRQVMEALAPGSSVRRSAPAAPVPAPPPRSPKDARLQIEAARRQLDRGNYDAALVMARSALAAHPGDRDLLDVVALAEQQAAPAKAKARLSPAPPRRTGKAAESGRTPDTLYIKAQHADTKEKDWPKAEQLYRQAIAEGDNAERALRNLAWGLHGKKRSDEALALLRDSQIEIKDPLAHQNMVITILSDRGKFDEAADLLEGLLRGNHTNQTRTSLLKRLIVAYRKLRDAERAKDAAERLLRHAPNNPDFRNIAADVEKAVRTGIWDKIDLLAATVAYRPEQSGSISLVLQSRLDTCDYAGVIPQRVQEGGLSEKDVQELDVLIRNLGSRRSADRAKYNLTAARILRDLGQTEDDRFRISLRSYGAAMGDLLTAERAPGDVIRTYYAEAVTIGPWNDMAELKVKQFITSYLPPDQEQPERRPNIEKCLEWVLEHENLRKPLLLGLLTLVGTADRKLIAGTWKVQALRDIFFQELWSYVGRTTGTAQNDYASIWGEAAEKLHQEMEAQRQELQLPSARREPLLTVREDQQLLEAARGLAPTGPLDTERIKKTIGTLDEVHGYLEQTAYLERERLESKIRTGITQLVRDIEELPTRLSLEFLVPLLKNLDSALAAHFAQVQNEAEPTGLEVTPVLSAYAPNAASTIQVQFSVTNLPRCSPAGDVMLRVLDNPVDYAAVAMPIPVAHSLRDGQTETCTVALTVTPRAIEEEVVTFRYQVEFSVRSDQRIRSEPETLSLRLNRAEDWKPIRNPYTEGPPVEDAEMFFGRDTLLDVLVDSLEQADAKCVVLYGQKRVGKSSILYHLQRRLPFPLIVAKLSLLDIVDDLNLGKLFYAISRSFWLRLEELELDHGLPPLDLPRPDLDQFGGSPQILFDDYMRDIQRSLRRNEAYKGCRMVLLLDEFTVLYTAIERGQVAPEFMKAWKALLESNLFSSVVVGNDLMPRFLKRFPNEFQVARQQPVSYLDEESATRLIEVPICLDGGETRYRGDAVRRILELTARNPYYIQLFCNRLVQHMNDERQPLIGPADVDRVAATLVSGEQAISLEQFDNLLTPGDADVGEIAPDSILDLLRACQSGHRGDLYLDYRKAQERPDGPKVIDDLLRRDVIVQGPGDRYRIKVALFAEWLHHRRSWETA